MDLLAYDRWAKDYVNRENLIAEANLKRALNQTNRKLSPLETVRAVYIDKIDGLETKHAYPENGNIGVSVLLHRATVKELFPIPDKKDFESLLGVSITMLEDCIKEKLIIPLIQLPAQYEKLSYLHKILMTYNPACYEIRDKVIYRYLSNGKYDEYLEHAFNNPAVVVKANSLDYMEDYEKFLKRDNQSRWDIRSAQRYAALASLSGEADLLNALHVNDYPMDNPENVKYIQDVFFDLHRKVLHPLTQGLGGLPYNIQLGAPSINDLNISTNLESEMIKSLDIGVPQKLNMKTIAKVHETSIPDRFTTLETSILEAAEERNLPSASIEDAVSDVAAELYEKSMDIDSKAKIISTAITVTALGVGFLTLKDNPTASFIAASVVPSASIPITGKAFDFISRVYGKSNITWMYWKLKKEMSMTLKGK